MDSPVSPFSFFSSPVEEAGPARDRFDSDIKEGDDGVSWSTLLSCLRREIVACQRYNAELYMRGYPVNVTYHSYESELVQMKTPGRLDLVTVTTKQERENFINKFNNLADSPVFTRLIMPTGSGKTTRLPWLLANKIQGRVMLLTPTVSLAYYAIAGIKANGGRVTKSLPVATTTVVVSTYADFVCENAYGKWKNFKQKGIQLIIVDEAHENSAWAYAVRAILTTYLTDVSVVYASATQAGKNVQEVRKRTPPVTVIADYDVKSIYSDSRWDEGGDWARDRTVVFLPTDDYVYRMRDAMETKGYSVYMLDSASNFSEIEAIKREFEKDVPTLRILLAIPLYGTGYALPVTHVIDTCLRGSVKLTPDGIVEALDPITEAERLQHAGRAARDKDGMGSVVHLSGVQMDPISIRPGDEMLAWVLLVFCGIRPSRGVFPQHSAVFGTRPMFQAEAMMYLQTVLPLEVFHWFRAVDGLVARKYLSVIHKFCYPNVGFVTSDQELPVNHDKWIVSRIGNYYVNEVNRSKKFVKMPCAAPPRQRILFNAIVAAAEGHIDFDVGRWDYLDLDYPSDFDEEVVEIRAVPRELTPVVTSMKRQRAIVVPEEPQYSYFNQMHIGNLHRAMTNYNHKRSTMLVQADGNVIEITVRLYSAFAKNESPNEVDYIELLTVANTPSKLRLLVNSEMFDHWSAAWDAAVYTTGRLPEYLRFTPELYKLSVDFLTALTSRFDAEVALAVSVSKTQQVIGKNLVDRLRRMFNRSVELHNWIHQPEPYVNRVATLHQGFIQSISVLNKVSMYSPALNVWATRDVPWSGGSARRGSSGNIFTRSKVKAIDQGEDKPFDSKEL